jgi:NADP-dependent 3-hydroxy acid dehydrogenase YdfG
VKTAIVTGASSGIGEAVARRQEIIPPTRGEAVTLARVLSGLADVFFSRYDARVRENF